MSKVNNKLHSYIENAIGRNGENSYLITDKSHFTYKQIYEMAITFIEVLIREGIQKNDRVVIYSSKNAASIALMIACSKCECIYIPITSINPANRAKYIIDETAATFIACDEPCGLELNKTDLVLQQIHSSEGIKLFAQSSPRKEYTIPKDSGFILFTSGSTGTPKGVVISHAAAIVFIDWAAKEFEITDQDHIASIAPFNFDLSVFDIYVTAKMSATLHLYTEKETKNALLMAQKISTDLITTIYGTPTFYSTLANYGKLNKYDYSSLKNVLFAGEVFHTENFYFLLKHWPDKNYANLYGPTETNVCTFYKLDTKNKEYAVFPIGKNCEFAQLLIVDENDNVITESLKKGELLVAGQSLFNEYWNDRVKTQSTIFFDKNGTRYYRTGDIVYKDNSENLVYVNRKDRMIKKNGFRIEPGEIERVMLSFPNVSNAAVIFSANKNQLICFLESPHKTEEIFLKLKQFCQNHLPVFMIPDKFITLDAMPKTSSGKVDLLALDKQL